MIDIHSHLLPGMDDGAKDTDASISMANVALKAGFQTIVATPHIGTQGEFEAFKHLNSKAKDLQILLDAEGIPLRVLPGAEVFPSDMLVSALSSGAPPTLAESSYILIGLPLLSTPMDLGQVLFESQTLGFRPILAHPERVLNVQQDPESLLPYLERGVLLQMNAGSITGRYGKQAMTTAHILLKHRWVHFLASDAHSKSAYLSFPEAISQIESLYGEETARVITVRNQDFLLDNKEIPSDPLPYAPEQSAIKRFWNFFTHRQ